MTSAELKLVREKYPVSETVARRSCPEAKPGLSVPIEAVGAARKITTSDEQKLNKLERAFLLYLRANGYPWIGIQCITLKLAFDTRYTPDLWTHGQWGFRAWEVKGPHAWEDSLIKLKVAARLFPMIQFTLVRRAKGGGWKTEDVRS